MMGRKKKGEVPPPLFQKCRQVGKINMPKVVEKTRKIQGCRSQKLLAKIWGYSESRVSQLLSGQAISIELEFAQAIWNSREQDCEVTEEEFLEAFGYAKKLEDNQTYESNPEQLNRNAENPESKSLNTRNIVLNAVLAKKYPILDTATNYFLKNTIDEKIPMDFLVKTQTTESQNIELAFKFLPNSIFEVKDFFKSLFASLYTMNSNFPSMRYSAVISDRKVFKTLRKVYCNVTVDNYISVILIDDKRQAIADEFIMPTKGESNFTESILT